MTAANLPDSFSADAQVTVYGSRGERAHRDLVAHAARFEPQLVTVAPGVWCMVGNGLSNQTFVEGPGGLIAIDTGECVEEMAAALAAVRTRTSAPVVAVIYTHFHYVAGTAAVVAEGGANEIPVWGHERIVGNRARAATLVSAAYERGLVSQFGMLLPADGPDGLLVAGIGRSFRNPDHAPYTPGFIAPTNTINGDVATTIAGLRVEFTPTPSDSDDSITIWFPDLAVCVNNLVWPALYNIFAIRGEEYRDPRGLLRGNDHILSLSPDYLVGTHGPPLSGRDLIEREVTLYRDAIQFLWDQTVRGINRGLTLGELTEFVQLPSCFGNTYFTQQLYGVVEHHVRQIHAGLVGWFDGDEAALLPLPPVERAMRLIDGFGGRTAVQAKAEAALADNDLRWALELATWLVRSETGVAGRADGGTASERAVLAAVLRTIAQCTTSANIRNWCLTRALELESQLDLARFRTHRFRVDDVRTDPVVYVHTLRVLVDPASAADVDDELGWRFPDGTTAGLRVRHGVALPTDGSTAEVIIELDVDTFAKVLARRMLLADAVAGGTARITGDTNRARNLLACFDHDALHLA